jgi:hypothetical protein
MRDLDRERENRKEDKGPNVRGQRSEGQKLGKRKADRGKGL